MGEKMMNQRPTARCKTQPDRQKRLRPPASGLWLFASCLVLLLLSEGRAQQKDSCVECHSQVGGSLAEAVNLMRDDIHRVRGLSCVDCHGGDATQEDQARAMDRKKGFVGAPQPKDIPAFC